MPGGVHLSPIEITAAPLSRKTIQNNYYDVKPKIVLRRGPRVDDRTRQEQRIPYRRTPFPYQVPIKTSSSYEHRAHTLHTATRPPQTCRPRTHRCRLYHLRSCCKRVSRRLRIVGTSSEVSIKRTYGMTPFQASHASCLTSATQRSSRPPRLSCRVQQMSLQTYFLVKVLYVWRARCNFMSKRIHKSSLPL